jgi:integrase
MTTTIADLCDAVLAEYEACGRSSKPTIEYRIQRHVKRLIGSVIAEACDTPDLLRYVSARKAEGASGATINRELAVIGRGYRLYRKTLTAPTLPRCKESPPRQGYFTRSEFDALSRELTPDVRDAFHFAFLTGWRLASEVLPLKWSQVQWGDHGGILLPWGESKTGEIRRFPFAGPIGEQLVSLLKRRRAMTPETCPWVFHRDGERIRSVRNGYLYACKRAGLKKMPHDLRRTAMRNLLLNGVSLEMAMQLTGHKSATVARRYGILVDADLEHAMRRMSRPDLPKNGDDVRQAEHGKAR